MKELTARVEAVSRDVAQLQVMIDGLGTRLRSKEDEVVKLRETMQVDDGCDARERPADGIALHSARGRLLRL